MLRPSQVEVPGTKETFTPMRHLLAVDKQSRAAEIPQQLKGGQKLSAIPKERVEDALNNLLAHMESQPEMYWPMSYRKGIKNVTVATTRGALLIDESKIVQAFLSKQPGVRDSDIANKRLPFYRNNYTALFNFAQVARNTVKWTAVEQDVEPAPEAPEPARPRPQVGATQRRFAGALRPQAAGVHLPYSGKSMRWTSSHGPTSCTYRPPWRGASWPTHVYAS